MEESGVDNLLGGCAAMHQLRGRVGQLAASELRVHVTGETGTGKELIARALHALSPRRARPFVPVNLAGFSDELFASELFGHARGAFTGAVSARDGYVAQAEGGSLFIDEVADMSTLAQVRLLRFLEQKEYQRVGETLTRRANVRVISATNVDLARRVREGRFREDLLYRLNGAAIVAPPLRERGRDVLLLARHFLHRSALEHGRPTPSIGAEAERLLLRHSWPGNVRELESEMRRLAVEAPGRELRASDLSSALQEPPLLPGGGLRAALQRYEMQIVREVLERHGGVQARAAAELGITRQALCAKLRKWGWLLQAA